MASLNDVLGTPRTVEVRGKSVQVSGVPLELFPILYRRFPDECSRLGEMTGGIDPEFLVTVLPALVAPIIAAGLGHPGDLVEEAAVKRLNFMEQIKLLKVIWEETAPDGLDPLIEEVKSMLEQLTGAPTATAETAAVATNGAASKASSKRSPRLPSSS